MLRWVYFQDDDAPSGWQTVLSATKDGGVNARNDCARQAFTCPYNATKIRITVEAPATKAMTIDNASIVARSGTTADGTTTPTDEILWGSTSGISVSNGGSSLSDELTYILSEGTDYLISMDFLNGTAYPMGDSTATGETYYFSASENCYNVQNMPAGYSTESAIIGVSKIEVFIP